MEKIRLGSQTFRVKSGHSLLRYETTALTWFCFFLLTLGLIFGLFPIAADRWAFLFASPLSLAGGLLIPLTLSSLLSFGTKLFKAKVLIDKRSRTIYADRLFRLGGKSAPYRDLVLRRVRLQGASPDTTTLYLAEKILREKARPPLYRNYIKLGGEDEGFLPALALYMESGAPPAGPAEEIRSLEALKTPSPGETLRLARSYAELAALREEEEDWPAAEREIRKALKLGRTMKEDFSSFSDSLLSRLAAALFKQGKIREALKQYRAVYRREGDPDDLHAAALCHAMLGELPQAIEALNELCRQWTLPEDLLFLSDLYLIDRREREARELLTSALEQMEEEGDRSRLKALLKELAQRQIDLPTLLEREQIRFEENRKLPEEF